MTVNLCDGSKEIFKITGNLAFSRSSYETE